MDTDERRRVGRPPRDGSAAAEHRLEIRLTAKEVVALENAAGSEPISVWVRRSALAMAFAGTGHDPGDEDRNR